MASGGESGFMGMLLIIGVAFFGLAGYLLWKRRDFSARMSILRRAVPATAGEIANAFPGEIVSVTGTARTTQPLTSEQSETPCVYYDFEVIEHSRRRRNMVNVGPSRRRRHRAGRRSRKTVAENTQWCPFIVEDQSGQVGVIPDGAFFEARQVMNRYERQQGSNPLGIPGLEIDIGWGDRVDGYRIRESVIEVDSPVFVAGAVDENGQLSARSNGTGMIVTHRSESAIRDEWGNRERWTLYGAILTTGIGLFLLLAAFVQWVSSGF